MNIINSIYRIEEKRFKQYKFAEIPTVFCLYHKNDADSLYTLKILENLCKKYYHVLCYVISFASYRKIHKPCYRRDSYNIWVYQSGIRIYNIKEPTLDNLDHIFNTIDFKCSSVLYLLWKQYKEYQEARMANVMVSDVVENADLIIAEYLNSHIEEYLCEQSLFYNYKLNILKLCLIHGFSNPLPYPIKIKQSYIHKQQEKRFSNPEGMPELIPQVLKLHSTPFITPSTSTKCDSNPFFSYKQNIIHSNTISYPKNDLFLNYSESLQNQNLDSKYFNKNTCFESLRISPKIPLNKENEHYKVKSKKYFKPIILKRNESPLYKKDEKLKLKSYENISDHSISKKSFPIVNEYKKSIYAPKEYAFKYVKKRKCATNHLERYSVIHEHFIPLPKDAKNLPSSRPTVIHISNKKSENCSSESDKIIIIDKNIFDDASSEREKNIREEKYV